MMTVSRLGPALAMVLMTSTWGVPAFAQSTSDKVAAEGLFDQGRAAMQRGDFAQACGLLERSQRIDPAVGTLLYLAECYERSGRTATAWATFREAADAADAAHETARARVGRERAARLEPRLAKLTIQVPAELEQIQGLVVERGGQSVPAATWNVPVPVDPGDHAITVSAPGYDAWSTTISVPPRAASVSVPVPQLTKNPEAEKAGTGAAAAPGAPPGTPSAEASEETAADSETQSASDTASNVDLQRTAAYALGGVGALGIVMGSVFGLRAISKNSDAEGRCPRGFHCDDALGPSLTDEARSAATVSNIAFGLGFAALGGAAALYFTLPKPAEPQTAKRGSAGARATVIRARPGLGSIMVEGSF
jgi:serine/threonine-protein kinase